MGKADPRERVVESLRHPGSGRRQRERSVTPANKLAALRPDLMSGVTVSQSNTSNGQLAFAGRHIGPDSEAIANMLAVIGVDSLNDLAAKALPAGILDKLTGSGAAPGLDRLPPAASGAQGLAELAAQAAA